MLRFLYRRAQIKGLFGGSRGWTLVWAVLLGGRVLRRLMAAKPEVVYSARLRPGEALVIRSGDRPVPVVGPADERTG
jgi:hypothetical protein